MDSVLQEKGNAMANILLNMILVMGIVVVVCLTALIVCATVFLLKALYESTKE